MRVSRANQPANWGGRFRPPFRRPARRVSLMALAVMAAICIACAGSGQPAVESSEPPTVENGPVVAFAPRSDPQVKPTMRELLPTLTRYGFAADDVELAAIFTPPLFFQAIEQEPPIASFTQPSAVFVMQESVHDGDLPESSDVFLLNAKGERIAPSHSQLLDEGPHHRSTQLIFLVDGGVLGEQVTLVVAAEDGSVANSFVWDLPLLVPGTESSATGAGDASQASLAGSALTRALQCETDDVAFGGLEEIEFAARYATREY